MYGRLDVHEPAGAIKSYRLSKEVTTIGTAADNGIVLADPSVSDRHCRLQLLDGLVHAINLDPLAGIMFAGSHVRDSLPRPMREVTELALGKTKIVFYPSDSQPTLPMASISENTRPIRASLHVELEKTVLDVYPASSSSLEIAVTNRGAQEITFTIDVDGLPVNWAKLSQSSGRLDGDDTAFIILSVAPARRADIEPGEYPATIVMRTTDNDDSDLLVGLMVRLHGFGGLSLAVEPALVREGKSLQLFMLNQGNEDLRLALSAGDPEGQLDIDLMERGVQLAAGQRGIVSCRVAARDRPLLGKSREIPFALLVQADNDSAYLAAIPAGVLVKPRLSARHIGAAIVLIAAFAMTLFALLARRPPPEISSFAISESQVARGTTVELNWQASFAERFVIEIDRAPIAELDADAGFFALSTADYADPIEVALIAVADELTDIEKRQLDVYQPVTITHFEADRGQMFRKVEGELLVTWRTEGAVSSDLRFPSQFNIVSEEDPGGGTRKMVLRGVPETDFDLVLAAQDEIGTRIERRISVKTADPECAPLRDLSLFAGPGRLYDQVKLALRNVPVLVLGSTEARDWMLVELASGEHGWGRLSDFFCVGFDPTALTVISDLPPLPKATPTRTPEPALSPTPADAASPAVTPDATTAATAAET
ncbi:MAG: FHA domain-containing protein [Chloroflexi bacterium]|nr:FHA domain-containing protein [Chloroflexota bacterium]